MPKVSVKIPHGQDPAEAVEKVKAAIEKTVKDFQGNNLDLQWEGKVATFNFKSMAFTIGGTATVEDSDVTVEIDLPFAAMMFKDKAEKAIAKNLTRALE